MQNAASVTMLITPEGIVESSSGGLTRLLGIDQEWLEGRPLADLADDLDRPVLDEALQAVQIAPADRIPVPVTIDVRLRHAGATNVPFALTFTNLLDDPTVAGLVVTGHDISDRVALESDLRTANSVLAATLESTADGILVVDGAGRIASFNTRFAEMWRLPESLLSTRDDTQALAFVVEQLCEPEAFVAKIQELYDDPYAESHDTLEFKDGRVFERDSLPQRIDGEVVGRVWSFRDVSEHRRLQNELTHQAFHDPLTGLANQALFRDRVDHAATRLQRHGGQLAVLFIDLDDFKTVNDSLGHSAGDALLMIVSDRLTNCLRAGDTAARLGGDEFAILMDQLNEPDEATTVAERILATLQEPVLLDALEICTTASIGIAFGSSGAGSDEMLRNADLAMYTAKAGGKNCARVFAREMHRVALERLDFEAHLRGAAERGELVVHYQPMYELSSGRITALEALVRWHHPERGPLAPLAFIPFAEETGLIDEIGQHVLVSACEEARAVVSRAGNRRARDQRQRRAPAAARPTAPRPGGRVARSVQPRRRPVDPRDHRGCAHEGSRRRRRRAPAPQRARRAARGRRLRDRLLVARLPPAVPDRPAQDRPARSSTTCSRDRAPCSCRRSSRSPTPSASSRSPKGSRARPRLMRWWNSAAIWPRDSTSAAPPMPRRRACLLRERARPAAAGQGAFQTSR